MASLNVSSDLAYQAAVLGWMNPPDPFKLLAQMVTSEKSPQSAGVDLAIARSDHCRCVSTPRWSRVRSEEHTSELQSPCNLVCRLLLEKKKNSIINILSSPHRLLSSEVCEHSCTDASFKCRIRFMYHYWFPQHFNVVFFFFFFNDTATTEIYTLSLHDALPI